MFGPLTGHLQVLHVFYILLPNCNANIPIFINGYTNQFLFYSQLDESRLYIG
jgi:hypothetical protein